MSARTIEIDEEVFVELQRRAKPLIDDANSVLRRVLGLTTAVAEADVATAPTGTKRSSAAEPPIAGRAPIHERGNKQETTSTAMTEPSKTLAPRGSRLPQAEYELPILESVIELGDSAPSSRVIKLTGKKLKARLTPLDYTMVKSGETRWENRARFARLMLKNLGQLAKDSPHGTWEITEAGRDRVTAQGVSR